MLLQTLRTRDFDELAKGFHRWDHHFRQTGHANEVCRASAQNCLPLCSCADTRRP
jgi:hypothetical protein